MDSGVMVVLSALAAAQQQHQHTLELQEQSARLLAENKLHCAATAPTTTIVSELDLAIRQARHTFRELIGDS